HHPGGQRRCHLPPAEGAGRGVRPGLLHGLQLRPPVRPGRHLRPHRGLHPAGDRRDGSPEARHRAPCGQPAQLRRVLQQGGQHSGLG
ncbi:Tyr recombinase domain-containing protein, partial [Dysosmobacter welbionis]